MQAVFELARSVLDLDTTVLIYGETGVGKELLARSIHFSGARCPRPFVAVNCAAIPEELFESELFGFRKGAFTGAHEHRRGLFQMANGGTLLLDEIGEMPLHLQSKLLRAIEEKRVTSVGADRPVDIDVRFIATTNKDLQAEVERGAFRRDLFYRLSVMPIRIPPLRERPEDIPMLAQHFLEHARRRTRRTVHGIAPESLQALVRYGWPGNVRELENVIERAVIVAKGEILTDLQRFLAPVGAHAAVDLSLPFRDAKARVVEEFERAYVAGLLESHGGKLTAAAKHADMDPKNFSDKMTRYGLRRAAPAEPPGGERPGPLARGDAPGRNDAERQASADSGPAEASGQAKDRRPRVVLLTALVWMLAGPAPGPAGRARSCGPPSRPAGASSSFAMPSPRPEWAIHPGCASTTAPPSATSPTRDAGTPAASARRSRRGVSPPIACSRARGVAASRRRGSPSAPPRSGRRSAISSVGPRTGTSKSATCGRSWASGAPAGTCCSCRTAPPSRP